MAVAKVFVFTNRSEFDEVNTPPSGGVCLFREG